jgi:Tol biopolymer transport system component
LKRRLALGLAVLVALALIGVSLGEWWARRLPPPGETEFLPGVSAFSPVPSPDGSLVAFVRVGWAGMGLGQSNLETDVFVADARGTVLSREPVAPGLFLQGWTLDGKEIACSRASVGAQVRPGRSTDARSASKADAIWFRGEDHRFVPSPDGRHVAEYTRPSRSGTSVLVVTDQGEESPVVFGEIVVCPSLDWEWMGSTWSPWSHDGSAIAFVSSENDVVVASPDGAWRRTVTRPALPAALATISPDGRHVAFVTYDPTSYPRRSDLVFHGNAVVWVAANRAGARATAVTKARPETCFHLRWLGDSALVFDRLKAPLPYEQPRIYRVQLDPAVLGDE